MHKLSFQFRFLLIAAFLWPASYVDAQEFEVQKGLQFKTGEPGLTLDLYVPKNSKNETPCIIVIQGGGFRPQNGQRFKPFAEHLAKNGFAAALISYRGSPDHLHGETLEDVKASVRYVRRIAGKNGINGQRIGAMGGSAGGTLAALLAVTGSESDAQSQIQAAVCFAGVFDFVSRFTDKEQLALQPRHKTKIVDNGKWIGTPFSTTDKDWLTASAITHVDPNDPPILFLHSRDDSTVPWPQSRDMHRVMSQVQIASEIKVYETGGHGVRPVGQNPLDDMIAFFQKHLGKKK